MVARSIEYIYCLSLVATAINITTWKGVVHLARGLHEVGLSGSRLGACRRNQKGPYVTYPYPSQFTKTFTLEIKFPKPYAPPNPQPHVRGRATWGWGVGVVGWGIGFGEF